MSTRGKSAVHSGDRTRTANDIPGGSADTEVKQAADPKKGDCGCGCGGKGDCNDKAPQVHPGAMDDCGDGYDQDCDGVDRRCPEKGGCGCLHDPDGSGGNDGLVWLVVLVMVLGHRRLQGS